MNEGKQTAWDGPMDEEALREQLEACHAASFGWALTCCMRNQAEAEDVLQNVYLKILQGRARFEGRSSFKTWLFSVIRRTAADERRRQWLRRLGLERLSREPGGQDTPPPPSIPLAQQEDRSALAAALALLPRRQREVLHLVFYQDLTIQDAAGVMGVSLGSARTHYERGKQRLREGLRSEFGHEG
jgi:RNA polymerase sigma factor (sigma-70 family)